MKDKLIAILFFCFLLFFSLTTFWGSDRELSFFERRNLKTREDLKEDIFENLEDYMKDQQLFRDSLIKLNSTFDRYLLNRSDSNDVYVMNGNIIEKNYPLDQTSVDNFIAKINLINNTYLQNSNVYYSIIPDKSYFLDENNFLKVDFTNVFSKLKENIELDYIDITNLLSLDDYYKTDIHIKQESYLKILKKMDEFLHFGYYDLSYDKKVYENFKGASFSKGPAFIKADKMTTLISEIQKDIVVKHLEFGVKDVYELDKLDGVDAYNVYLGGPSSLIEIFNEKAFNDRELIIFRDSFASSMAPLLIPYYKKITLIDLRYIKMDLVHDYVDFANKDVLFMYSTLIVNNSHILKV